MRRGGVRQEVTERVVLYGDDGQEFEGWALNVSRGGLRAILEQRLRLGQKFDLRVGEDPERRTGRIVWVQEEPDGVIVGIEFTTLSGMHRSSVPPTQAASRAQADQPSATSPSNRAGTPESNDPQGSS